MEVEDARIGTVAARVAVGTRLARRHWGNDGSRPTAWLDADRVCGRRTDPGAWRLGRPQGVERRPVAVLHRPWQAAQAAGRRYRRRGVVDYALKATGRVARRQAGSAL